MRLFADDSVIYRVINGASDHQALSADLEKLDEWANTWQMNFKPEKCYQMSIINKRHPIITQYYLKNTPLQTVTTWTYLGVEIDNKLTWTPHCDKVKKSAMRSLGVIQRTLHAAPQSTKATAYQALVRPKLEYATTAWNPQTPGKTRILESVQNKAARFVTRNYSRYSSVTNIKQQLNWPPLYQRRQARDCIMWYKIHHNLVNLPFPVQMVSKPRLGRLDHHYAYLQLTPRVDAYKHSFFVRTIPQWNSLPSCVVSAPSLQIFKRLVLSHFCGLNPLP